MNASDSPATRYPYPTATDSSPERPYRGAGDFRTPNPLQHLRELPSEGQGHVAVVT